MRNTRRTIGRWVTLAQATSRRLTARYAVGPQPEPRPSYSSDHFVSVTALRVIRVLLLPAPTTKSAGIPTHPDSRNAYRSGGATIHVLVRPESAHVMDSTRCMVAGDHTPLEPGDESIRSHSLIGLLREDLLTCLMQVTLCAVRHRSGAPDGLDPCIAWPGDPGVSPMWVVLWGFDRGSGEGVEGLRAEIKTRRMRIGSDRSAALGDCETGDHSRRKGSRLRSAWGVSLIGTRVEFQSDCPDRLPSTLRATRATFCFVVCRPRESSLRSPEGAGPPNVRPLEVENTNRFVT